LTSLDIGCGPQSKRADVGVDVIPGPAVDVVHDLNVIPWPFAECSFDHIYCFDTLEHLHDVIAALHEIHRIAKPGATIEIQVPTGSSRDRYTDPTHLRGFGYRSFDYFDPRTEFFRRYGYTGPMFHINSRTFSSPIYGHLGFADKATCWFANHWPHLYERRLAYMFPADVLRFTLVAIKDQAPTP